MANRMSTFSTTSRTLGTPAAQQMSTTTLLNALHTIYAQGQCYELDASTSLAVNTWLNIEANGGQPRIDIDLARRAWEHARRRAEDGCIVLGSLHQSSPSLLVPFLHNLPFPVPVSLATSLTVIRAFTNAVTPYNASTPHHSALCVALTINITGELSSASISLSTAGLSTAKGLLHVPQEAGYRAFDVFYYLLASISSAAEREALGLKQPQNYSLLNKSGTYTPPSYLPTADDDAAAEDFRESLKAIGIRGAAHRNLLSLLASLLKLGNALGFLVDAEELDDICEDVANLLDLDPELLAKKCSTEDREVLVPALYEALLDWVIQRANRAIHAELKGDTDADESNSESAGQGGAHTPQASDDGDTVTIHVVEVPSPELGKALALRTVFDDTQGINAEMKEDGVEVLPAGVSVLKEMDAAVAQAGAELGPSIGSSREWERDLDQRQAVLEKIGVETESGSFVREILYPVASEGILLGKHGRFDLSAVLGSSRVWFHLTLHPTDEAPATLAHQPSAWSAGAVSRQLRAWRLPEWSNRRHRSLDYTADFDLDEFASRYVLLGCQDGRDGVENWIIERGWSNGDVFLGHERVWIRESAWWEAESMLDLKAGAVNNVDTNMGYDLPMESGYSAAAPMNGSGFFPPMGVQAENPFDSNINLVRSQEDLTEKRPKSIALTMAKTVNTLAGDYGLGAKGDDRRDWDIAYDGLDPEMGEGKHLEVGKVDASRRIWVVLVWMLTFWIPSFLLRYIGRMKRPDVRLAWREKLVLFASIILMNAIVVFWIVEFGDLLCPNYDKAWNQVEVSEHQGADDFYVSVRGAVYDITKFYKVPHGDPKNPTTSAQMMTLAGLNLDEYFPVPLYVGCSELTSDKTLSLTPNISNAVSNTAAVHTSGPLTPDRTLQLNDDHWYFDTFLPTMKQYYKGDLVWDKGNVSAQGTEDSRPWFILNGKVYDLTDYFYNVDTVHKLDLRYQFIPEDVTQVIQANYGQDISDKWKASDNFTKTLDCLNNNFLVGIPDFRKDAQCQVNNYILLAFTIVICTVIVTKFLAALRFGSKRMPAPQDKFVICQIPAYTEGEEHLRKGLDSLTALQYDNKRKLLCVICDGMVVGGGNDRPTPKIVLDILGVDPKVDPPALPFRSVGQGSEQLNYGKVYSGLYEFEGNVVPYIVVVKVGKESEQIKGKPGNRGKRDSQILLMSFLNRVHHRSPMSPLELEMFHQINNIIGVDPELYEFLLMVDADTSVREDALTRLVSACANDSKIAGICGETNLENEGRTWWTMIQVYEYFISHHLSKAFESLFGSVTCLPGCFTMYRLRTVDKGRPLIISDKIISDYSVGTVDTLHKKNLLSLGEDRYLTTLMTKYFPQMSYKFIPDAYAATAAPESWTVLLSQRRRWINSTIHNLVELVWLKDLCGFCCFSMRFVVFVDLFGTIILPSTCAYIAYLIYKIATHSGQFPLISIILIGAVYGLQALVFILKRQWQHVGWMIIYILAFPVYSFILPMYSFWKQDDFSWGSTRIVLEEKGAKKVIASSDDEGFDPRSIPLQRWDDYAANNNLPGRRGGYETEPAQKFETPYSDNAYEMDEIHSTYSSAHPATTVLTGMHQHHGSQAFITPQSPAAFHGQDIPRSQSRMSSFTRYTDAPQYTQRAHSRQVSGTDLLGQRASSRAQEPYVDAPVYGSRHHSRAMSSHDNLIAMHSPDGNRRSKSPLSRSHSRMSMLSMGTPQIREVDNAEITQAIRACLAEVDLDNVTKKQVRGLVEQKLGTRLEGEKRVFMDKQIDTELESM